MFNYKYIWLHIKFIIISALILSLNVAFATTEKNTTLISRIADQLEVGHATQLAVQVHTLLAADHYVITLQGKGALQTQFERHYPASSNIMLETEIKGIVASEGTGEVLIQVKSIDADATEKVIGKGYIFGYQVGTILYLSTSSLLDAQFKALQATQRVKASNNIDSNLSKLLQAPVVETNIPSQQKPLRVAEVLIDQAFAKTGLVALNTIQKIASHTIIGQVQWTDSNGTTHPLPNAMIEIYDKGSELDVNADTLLGTVITNASGNYSTNVSHDDGFQGTADIFIRVLAKSAVAEVKPHIFFVNIPYFAQSTVYENRAEGSNQIINLTIGNTTEAGQAFSIHHALVAAGAYISSLNDNVIPGKIDVRFPTTSRTSQFTRTNELHILLMDRWDWDIIHHEYAHYIAQVYGLSNSPGGSHNPETNLSISKDSKDLGLRLAWGEGWPTFFAIAAQVQSGLASLGIPNVGDLGYQDTEDSDLALTSLEALHGLGEDNEVSVMTTLWDLVDADDDGESVTLSPKALHDLLKANKVTTLGALWSAVSGIMNTPANKSQLGELFALNQVAPRVISPSNLSNFDVSTLFDWLKNGGGSAYALDEFTVRFFDSTFTTQTHQVAVGNKDTFISTQSDINAATVKSSLVRWVVTGKHNGDPVTPSSTDEYWSKARILNGATLAFVIDDTESMKEEIGGVRDALTEFLNMLESGLLGVITPPTMHLVTFKDTVTHRLTTNNISEMRSAIAGLTAAGGGDCPEASSQALLEASELLSNNGFVILATDASSRPGVALGALLGDLRSRGITVNTILSGDCSPTGSLKVGASANVADSGYQKPTESGEDEEYVGAITDPGTTVAADFVGDSAETATEIKLGSLILGKIEERGDQDYFKFKLEANTQYTIALKSLKNFSVVEARLRDDANNLTPLTYPTGTTSGAIAAFTNTEVASFTVPHTGAYYLNITAYEKQNGYELLISSDRDLLSFVPSSIKLFSVISAETGGVFDLIKEVNLGDGTTFVNTLFNILRSTVIPSVVNTNINNIPRGATVTVTVAGLNTNWNVSTKVSLSNLAGEPIVGLMLDKVIIQSPTSLSFTLMVASDAVLTNLNLHTETNLGDKIQTASGIGIMRIVEATTVPTLLSLTPSRVLRGKTSVVTIQGLNTQFTAAMSANLGAGVIVNQIEIISSTEAKLTLNIAADAGIGFRSIKVGELTLPDSLLIGAESTLPSLISLAPTTLRQGETNSLVVNGLNTHFVQDITSAELGTDIVINLVKVVNTTEAIVNVTVNPEANLGFRDMTVITHSERASLLNGLYIDKSSELLKIAIPNVVNLTEMLAIQNLETLGLKVGNILRVKHNTIAKGLVIAQSPTSQTLVQVGSPVDLTIADGAEPLQVIVPSLVNMPEAGARAKILLNDLMVGSVSYTHHPTLAKGLVISQTPNPSALVSPQSKVSLVISLGATSEVTVSGGGGVFDFVYLCLLVWFGLRKKKLLNR